MELKYEGCKIISNEEIAKGIYKLHVAGSFSVKPGQFFMLSGWEGYNLLPRPISVHDVDERGIHFLYMSKGKGTKLISQLRVGEDIKVLGPLGNGFEVEKIKGKIAVVTGGIGIAPMNYLVKSLKDCKVDIYCGFREELYGLEEINKYINIVNIATDTGTVGHHGFVTDIFRPESYDMVLCCGPEAMMKKVAEKCREHSVPVYLSMEKFMACGMGACLVCTCKTIFGNKRTCVEGPVFSGEELCLDA
jgi:dihydroorotate dehydrogenase electron transfer subunit